MKFREFELYIFLKNFGSALAISVSVEICAYSNSCDSDGRKSFLEKGRVCSKFQC